MYLVLIFFFPLATKLQARGEKLKDWRDTCKIHDNRRRILGKKQGGQQKEELKDNGGQQWSILVKYMHASTEMSRCNPHFL